MRTNIQDRYGRLQVVEVLSEKRQNSNIKDRVANCVCDCGEAKTVMIHNLISGRTKSCGCLERESRIKHGLYRHPLYSILSGMIRRCHTGKDEKELRNYKMRGIIVCDQWRNDKVSFIEWGIENGWSKGLTIERINNDGNYEPSNCRFATYAEQSLNNRRNVRVTFEGVTKTLTEWSREWGVGFKTLQYRFKVGRFVPGTIIPVGVKMTRETVVEIRNLSNSLSVREIANRFGITTTNARYIIKRKTWKDVV